MPTANALASSRGGDDRLSLTFAALADPTRRAILERLSAKDLTVSEIAAPLRMSMPAVSKHLRVLERARLISRGREAQFRPCHLTAEPLLEVMEFARAYERFWGQKLDALEDYLVTLKKTRTPEGESPAGSHSREVDEETSHRQGHTKQKKGTHGNAKRS